MAAQGLTLWGCAGHNTLKVLITASLKGVQLHVVDGFTMGIDNLSPGFMQKSPMGKVPVLELDTGETIFGSNAICRFLARQTTGECMYGATPVEMGQVEQWVDFATSEVDAPLLSWVLPLLGVWPYCREKEQAAVAAVHRALAALEAHLQRQQQLQQDPGRPGGQQGQEWGQQDGGSSGSSGDGSAACFNPCPVYLVGGAASLADVVMVATLLHGFSKVFDPSFRAHFPCVASYFSACAALPAFREHLGDVPFCEQRLKHMDKGKVDRSIRVGGGARVAKWESLLGASSSDVLQQLQLWKDLYRATPAERIHALCGRVFWEGEEGAMVVAETTAAAEVATDVSGPSTAATGQVPAAGAPRQRYHGLDQLLEQGFMRLWLLRDKDEAQAAADAAQRSARRNAGGAGSGGVHGDVFQWAVNSAKKLGRSLQPYGRYLFGVVCVVSSLQDRDASRIEGVLLCPGTDVPPCEVLHDVSSHKWTWTPVNKDDDKERVVSLLCQNSRLDGGARVLNARIIK